MKRPRDMRNFLAFIFARIVFFAARPPAWLFARIRDWAEDRLFDLT